MTSMLERLGLGGVEGAGQVHVQQTGTRDQRTLRVGGLEVEYTREEIQAFRQATILPPAPPAEQAEQAAPPPLPPPPGSVTDLLWGARRV